MVYIPYDYRGKPGDVFHADSMLFTINRLDASRGCLQFDLPFDRGIALSCREADRPARSWPDPRAESRELPDRST